MNDRLDRLLASGAMIEPRPRHVRRAEGWVLSAFAIGGVLGLAYHVLAPALVAALEAVGLWWTGQ